MNEEMRNSTVAKILDTMAKEGITLSEFVEAMRKMEPMKEMPDKKEENSEKKLFKRVTKILKEIGIPANLAGHKYVRSAIINVYNEGYRSMTRAIYPTVAEEYDTYSSRVERAIRHAIEAAWDRANFEAVEKYFGNTVASHKGKPTNGEFIAAIVDYLKIEDM